MIHDSHSITEQIAALKNGDEQAVRLIWDRFYNRVCALARQRLLNTRKREFDEEDIAQSAFQALLMGAQNGSFRQLHSRNDIWQLLAVITSRKVANMRRRQGTRNEAGESALAHGIDGQVGGNDVLGNSSNEEFVETLTSACEALFAKLDARLQTVALLKFKGHTNAEIGESLNRSEKSVERYLKMIRESWSEE